MLSIVADRIATFSDEDSAAALLDASSVDLSKVDFMGRATTQVPG